MDAPSRGSCTPKIPRTLANGELTMYSRSALLPQFGFVSPEASFDPKNKENLTRSVKQSSKC